MCVRFCVLIVCPHLSCVCVRMSVWLRGRDELSLNYLRKATCARESAVTPRPSVSLTSSLGSRLSFFIPVNINFLTLNERRLRVQNVSTYCPKQYTLFPPVVFFVPSRHIALFVPAA